MGMGIELIENNNVYNMSADNRIYNPDKITVSISGMER